MTNAPDLRELLAESWDVLTPGVPLYTYCKKHGDENRPSLAVYDDHAYCYTCGAYYPPDEFVKQFSPGELLAAKIVALSRTHRAPPPKQDATLLAKSASQLLRDNPNKWRWLERRGIPEDFAGPWLLGHNGVAYTFPVFDADREIVNIRYRRDDEECPDAPKYWGLRGYNGTLVYGIHAKEGETMVMTEGELDALLLIRYGLNAFSLTNGARSGRTRPEEWASPFAGVKRLVLCRDQDAAGREGTARLAETLSTFLSGVPITVLTWRSQEKDVGELWQYNPEVFRAVVRQLESYT